MQVYFEKKKKTRFNLLMPSLSLGVQSFNLAIYRR